MMLRGRGRTQIEVEANEIDLDLFRILQRLLSLPQAEKNDDIVKAMQAIRAARRRVRMLMHPVDREETEG